MTKMLPALVAAGTALITTAMVQAVYALFWFGRYLIDGAVPAYNWAGAFTASIIATTLVLLASLATLRLMAGRPSDEFFADEAAHREALPAFRIAGTSE
ncbi:MAG TPA: hypothetical protein VJQ81_06620 [Reyranella sp.]|nr:hypothetical protein [Reyranella sp.]